MRTPPDAKLYELRPLTGPLEPSSSPDAVLAGGHRWVQNFRINSAGALSRANGFRRLLYTEGATYNNADLHWQLENTSSGAAVEDLNFLFEAEISNGVTKLLAGSKGRLYALNIKTNNWKLIGEGLATAGQWKAAQLGEFVVLVNEHAKPVYYKLDQPKESQRTNSGLVDKVNSLKEIESFKGIGLNRVKHITEWRGLMFYANVNEGNEWVPDRLVWSDFKKPFEITPNVEDSLAGYQDLGQGEDIIGMEPLSNVLLVYTTKGIWQFEVAGGTGTDVLTFRKRYSDDDSGNMIPNYPNTIVAAGNEHFYLGRDGIYYYSIYRSEPVRDSWLHLASSIIFDDINQSKCELPIAAFNAKTDEIWISWPSKGATKNDKTLIINTKYKHVSYMDAGFSAFTNFTNQNYTSIAEWAISNCVCAEGGATHGIHQYRDSSEGSSVCSGSENFSTTRCAPNINNLFTTSTKTYSDSAFPDDNLATEDWTSSAASDTLYTKLGLNTFADLCDESCPEEVRFVMVWTKDNCLKEDGNHFKRERCTSTHPAGTSSCPTYTDEDFNSILTSPALRLNDPTRNKLLRTFTLEFDHDQVGGQISLRIGNSAQAADPNKVGCGLVWSKAGTKEVKCITDFNRNAHTENNTRASEELTWPVYEQGRNLYYELSVSGTAGAFEATAIRLYASTKKA